MTSPRRKRILALRLKKVSLFLASVILALGLSEIIVRVTHVDYRYLRKNLPWFSGNDGCHMADPNPEILYRLKPNAHATMPIANGFYYININSLGFRGPERDAVKPDGVFRIICLGGSNVFGPGVNDMDAWPAQLENELMKRTHARIEVWNFGISGHVGTQTSHIAREALRFNPDLLILGISNIGQWPFLEGTPIEPYFEKYPKFWDLYVPFGPVDYKFISPPLLLWRSVKINLSTHSHAIRYLFMIGATVQNGFGKNLALTQDFKQFEDLNIQRYREFLRDSRDRVPSCIFFGPYSLMRKNLVTPPWAANKKFYLVLDDNFDFLYWRGLKVRTFYLSSEGHSDEYRKIHPPPYVYAWYAEKMANWLISQRMVPMS